MSRTIDQTAVNEGRWEELSDDDIRYLHDRDMVPLEVVNDRGISVYPGQEYDLAKALQGIPNLGVVNTQGLTGPPPPLSKAELQPRPENLTKPQLRGEDEEEDEESEEDVEDYANWTNDQLRAELAERGLSVQGKQADLRARLLEDDESEEEDDEE